MGQRLCKGRPRQFEPDWLGVRGVALAIDIASVTDHVARLQQLVKFSSSGMFDEAEPKAARQHLWRVAKYIVHASARR